MACAKCGRVGAEVRPDWSPHTRHMQPGVDLSENTATAQLKDSK